VGPIRSDFFPSEDDNILVQGVSSSQYALAYFGYAYYLPNTDTLRALPIINGERGVAPAVTPSFETISDGSYAPLSRPLFTYLNNAKYVANEALRAFLAFTMEEGKVLIDETGYISLPAEDYEAHLETLADLLA
jgi:phosphate transport system substrate-binding protein